MNGKVITAAARISHSKSASMVSEDSAGSQSWVGARAHLRTHIPKWVDINTQTKKKNLRRNTHTVAEVHACTFDNHHH